MTEQTTEEQVVVSYYDYKDIETIKRFINPHGRIIGRKHTKLSAGDQRNVAKAVKYARFMGLLPYTVK